MKRQRELENDPILQEEEHAVEWHSLWVWLIVEILDSWSQGWQGYSDLELAVGSYKQILFSPYHTQPIFGIDLS